MRTTKADAGRDPSSQDHAPIASRLRGTAILLVDDEPTVRFAVSHLLIAAGASVRAAASCEEAVAIARAEPFDLLLTDIEMPRHDGAAVAAAIAAILPGVVIVFMSGNPRARHVANGRIAGDARFVEKPFAGAALIDALTTALASPHAPGG